MKKIRYWLSQLSPFLVLLIAAGLGGLLAACEPQPVRPQQAEATSIYPNIQYIVVTIDGCQYLATHVSGGSGGWALTHKGNCSNPVHCSNPKTVENQN